MEELGIEEARATLGDLVLAAQQRGVVTAITRYDKRAAVIAPDADDITHIHFGDLLALVDQHAKERGTSRARMIRRYVAEGLAREGVISDTAAAVMHGTVSGQYGDN
jgi:ribbon-helix-helix CopG family protein